MKNLDGVLVHSDRNFFPLAPLWALINILNHRIARRHVRTFPQVAVFSFDHIGLTINMFGRYENSTLLLVEKYLREHIQPASDSIALDIGANIGNHSISFSAFVDQVLAFEPNPLVFEILKLNVRNNSHNVTPLNFALSDRQGEADLIVSNGNLGGSRIRAADEKSENKDASITITTTTLDGLDMGTKNIVLIKLDVEGHELEVLRGGEELLTTCTPIILFEQGKEGIEGGTSPVVSYLGSCGYSFYEARRNFDFGETLIGTAIGAILRSIFGEVCYFARVKKFRPKHYSLVLAINELRNPR